jgi:hypothetical protein
LSIKDKRYAFLNTRTTKKACHLYKKRRQAAAFRGTTLVDSGFPESAHAPVHEGQPSRPIERSHGSISSALPLQGEFRWGFDCVAPIPKVDYDLCPL